MKHFFTLCVCLLASLVVQAQGFVFQYQGENLADDATVVIAAEEDLFGDLSCETNNVSNPTSGLMLKLLSGTSSSVTAIMQINHNSLNAASIQWCMGGECSSMNSLTTLTKRFMMIGSEGVQFDAIRIYGEGYLTATLKVTIGLETHRVNIIFVNGDYDGITINTYTLTYKVDGEVYKTFFVEYGTTLTPEPAPTKEGYTFSGWCEIPETMPAHDVTVTGSFIPYNFKLTYIVDGVEYKTLSVPCGSMLTPEPAPLKEGYTFSGWNGLPATMPAHDVTVTGSFTINKYKLTYKVDGDVYKTFSVEYGTALTPIAAPTKEGHTFSGWSEILATMPAHNVTITGSFIVNKYKLTYKVDGEVYKTFSIDYGTTLTPIAAPTKEGHTFSGWNGLPATMPARDVTVTGSFTINQYRLTYILDGKEYKSYKVDYNTVIIPESVPVKKGMTFSGWGEVPETMPAHNVTLTGGYSWSKETVDGIVYQVADTLNNYVSVIGNDNISGGAEVLSSIELGGDTYTVNTIGATAFRDCGSLTSVAIPESIAEIGSNAFQGCSNLTSVTLESNAIVSASRTSSTSMKSVFGNQVKTYIFGASINSIGSYAFYNCSGLTSITIPNGVTSIGYSAFSGCNAKLYVNRGSDALLSVWNYGATPYEIGTDVTLPHPSLSAISTTQTTITYQINYIYPELDYEVVGEIAGDNAFIIRGLRPSYTQNVPLAIRSANNSYNTSTNVTTSPISPAVTSKVTTASSLIVQGSYTKGDAKVISTLLTMDGREMTNNEGYMHGLKPNTAYNCKYTVVVEYGDGDTYPYEGSYNIRTAPLTMITQQPKVISAGNVIVSAQSNLDDEETNVGFEWRRTDWESDFASNTGVAYLYEGTMEGYIRNLYTEKLWRYRPYYQSDSGNRYYGDWVGIDPTNTSYFEPTVHTYAQITVNGNRAEVKGYAMRGTDRVTSQGFMCWKSSSPYSLRKKAPSIPSDAVTVEASGNVMTAVFENLEYEAQYCYVAFVKTEENETFFGDVQTFSTNVDPDGIKDIEHSPLNIEVAWYSLDGKKLSKPQKGINILRYSDGTTRKVLVK